MFFHILYKFVLYYNSDIMYVCNVMHHKKPHSLHVINGQIKRISSHIWITFLRFMVVSCYSRIHFKACTETYVYEELCIYDMDSRPLGIVISVIDFIRHRLHELRTCR